MQVYHRKNGEEQPYWPAGPFKIRLPFVHYRWEFAEMVQALIIFVVSLAMIPLLEKYLGVPYDVALAYVVICGIGFMLPALLGVPLIPGRITPGMITTRASINQRRSVSRDKAHCLASLFTSWPLSPVAAQRLLQTKFRPVSRMTQQR